MKKPFIILLFVLLSISIMAQERTLILVPGKKDLLLDTNGVVFFELNDLFEFINSEIYGDDGRNGYHRSVAYPFYGFPFLVKQRGNGVFQLLDKSGETKAWLPRGLKGVAVKQGGFYRASMEVDEKLYRSTRFVFLDGSGSLVFSKEGYRSASSFSDGIAAVNSGGWMFINDLGHEVKILPDSMKNARSVTRFHEGVSIVLMNPSSKSGMPVFRPYVIDAKGNILVDVSALFPGKEIKNMHEFKGGVSMIEFFWDSKLPYSGRPIAFINRSGKVLLDVDHVIDEKVGEAGHIVLSRRQKNGEDKWEMYEPNGKQIKLPIGVSYIQPISKKYLKLTFNDPKIKTKSSLYDVQTMKFVYETTGYDCMGVVYDRALLKGANEDVKLIHLKTGATLFQSSPKDQKVYDLDRYNGKMEDVSIFYCFKDVWVPRISEMTGLKELNLSNLTIENIPPIANKEKLSLLRISNCRKLKELDGGINQLTKLSISGGTSLKGLDVFIQQQTRLKELHLINMDFSEIEKANILRKFPKAVIKGTAKDADYELQEVIDGF
ncbi:MAG TPA: hypothetical protein PKA12_03715 [Saprospiraceae bacterium]|nr:hypothetical protein [Saprospiraceae bacterium]